MNNFMKLPPDLPVPADDGACGHLEGMAFPEVRLFSTKERWVDLRSVSQSPTVLFFYPRSGEPHQPVPADWDIIPGARGCTPQSCGFRDVFQDFSREKCSVFGVSTQDTAYQQEFVQRNHFPFDILSDQEFRLVDALQLPTFQYKSTRLVRRLVLILNKGKIIRVFYPVFPPDKNAATVLDWIQENRPFA